MFSGFISWLFGTSKPKRRPTKTDDDPLASVVGFLLLLLMLGYCNG